MTVSNASFTDAPDAQGQSHVCMAVFDGVVMHNIDLRVPSFYSEQLNAWIAAGNEPTPYTPPPALPPTCQLWQLQAVMTAAQWTAVQNAIVALNNPAVSAFFAHGTNVIPANSTTLISLGAAIGLTADQVTALVQQASAVSIP